MNIINQAVNSGSSVIAKPAKSLNLYDGWKYTQSVENTKKVSKLNLNKNEKNNLAGLIFPMLLLTVLLGNDLLKNRGEISQLIPKKLKNIKFNKGIALDKKGNSFTGIIKDKLKSGDKIMLEYKNGRLIGSTREGLDNFRKIYANIGPENLVVSTKKADKISSYIRTKSFRLVKENGSIKKIFRKISDKVSILVPFK